MFYKKVSKPKKDYNNDNTDENNILEETNAIVKIAGMIIVNHIICGEPQLVVESCVILFGLDTLCLLLNAAVIMVLGYLMDRYLNGQCALLFSSISFFLFSIDITVKYFAYKT